MPARRVLKDNRTGVGMTMTAKMYYLRAVPEHIALKIHYTHSTMLADIE